MDACFVRAKDNPFRVARVLQLRYRLSENGWQELLSRLKRMNYRGAIVGSHGSGKTTLLEDLGDRLAGLGWELWWIRLNETNRTLPADRFASGDCGPGYVILIDGCEQLGMIDWWRVRWLGRRTGGMIVTTHSSSRMPTLFECRTSPVLLADLVAELDGDAGLSPGEIENLYCRHRGNLRDALRELYDRASGQHGERRA